MRLQDKGCAHPILKFIVFIYVFTKVSLQVHAAEPRKGKYVDVLVLKFLGKSLTSKQFFFKPFNESDTTEGSGMFH